MPDFEDIETYSPEERTRGLSERECVNCGEPGHEHTQYRVNRGSGRHGYRMVCPTAEVGS